MEAKVDYKTRLPDHKLPYYRLTLFMGEHFDDPELMSWFEWIKSKNIPCAVAMGTAPGNFGKLAVWVWGKEHGDRDEFNNVETMGRVVMDYGCPVNTGGV